MRQLDVPFFWAARNAYWHLMKGMFQAGRLVQAKLAKLRRELLEPGTGGGGGGKGEGALGST
jgi:hypothetical protein